jgi:hypothetical protein
MGRGPEVELTSLSLNEPRLSWLDLCLKSSLLLLMASYLVRLSVHVLLGLLPVGAIVGLLRLLVEIGAEPDR